MSKDPMPTFPSPTAPAASRTEVHLRYLDYFRAVLLTKLDGLPPHELRSSRLPSRWTPLELLKHLTHVEARCWNGASRDATSATRGVTSATAAGMSPPRSLSSTSSKPYGPRPFAAALSSKRTGWTRSDSRASDGTVNLRQRSSGSFSTYFRNTPATSATST